MRRPSASDYVFGHIAMRLGLIGSACYCLYLFAESTSAAFLALFVLNLPVALHGARARARVAGYREWQRSWQEMADPSAAAVGPERAPWQRGLQTILVLATWALLGLWLVATPTQGHEGAFTLLGGTFGLLTLRGIYIAVRPLARRTRSSRKPRHDAAEFIVRVIPAIPSASPSIARITSGLPDYCRRLMTPGSQRS